MTNLPSRELLDGTKVPETTTGEFRLAMGNIRQYLAELLGDESTDKETARLALGIDLAGITADIALKADEATVMDELAKKADSSGLSLVAMSGDYHHLVNKPILPGMVVMWSGAGHDIPDGWALCDGENGTPDLRDKFVIGAGNSYAVGATGGNTSQEIDLSGQTGATTLTVDQMPSHSHSSGYSVGFMDGGVGATELSVGNYKANQNPLTVSNTGGSQPHTHSLSGSATVSTLPPYYALCFIMKL